MVYSKVLLISLNIVALLLFSLDKLFAVKSRFRIKEKWLLTSAVCFGALGALIAMYTFHHKTRKPKFYITIPLLTIFQFIIILHAANVF